MVAEKESFLLGVPPGSEVIYLHSGMVRVKLNTGGLGVIIVTAPTLEEVIDMIPEALNTARMAHCAF